MLAKLDEKEIFGIGTKFMVLFFSLAKENKSFLNVLLGFLYSAKTVSKAMERLNIITTEELNKVCEELSKAVEIDFEKNMKLIEVLKKEMLNS